MIQPPQASNFATWAQAATEDAAPEGLPQAQTEQQAQATTRQQSGGFAQWAQQYDTTPTGGPGQGQRASWYGGRNLEGTNNGWSTDFWAKAVDQQKAIQNSGDASNQFRGQFDRPDATGVAAWDHTTPSGKQVKFGDVYEGGKKLGNLYDDYKTEDADLMMADFLFDKDRKEAINSDSDRTARYRREIEQTKNDNDKNFEAALKAKDFNDKVTQRAQGWSSGYGDDAALAVGGAVATGGLVASAGAALEAIPGPGTLVGTGLIALGAGIGGLGAYLNRDALTEQAARAFEVVSLEGKQANTIAQIGEAISQGAGVAWKFASPFSNLVQGATDAALGTVGDAKADFYKVDPKTGSREAPGWVQGLDIAATVADSSLQFASPFGMSAYSLQMGANIGGEITSLVASGGKTFDYSTAQFDNIFTDDKGHFDFVSAASGIGKIGIDAVQLGMVRGLAGKVASTTEAPVEPIATKIRSALPSWAGGRTIDKAAGQNLVEESGYSFVRNADGSIVEGSKRRGITLLAPSEGFKGLAIGREARIAARNRAAAGGDATVSTDDFYQAAKRLAEGGSGRLKMMMVTGVAEGYEEFVQAALEPLSHNHALDINEMVNSALYGFASGIGMGVGTVTQMPSDGQRLDARIRSLYQLSTGKELSDQELAGWDQQTKLNYVASNKALDAVLQAAGRQQLDATSASNYESFPAMLKLMDAMRNTADKDLEHLTTATDQVHQLGQNYSYAKHPWNAAVMSSKSLMRNFAQLLNGYAVQVQTVQAQVDEATTSTDPAKQEQLPALTNLLAQKTAEQSAAQQVSDAVAQSIDVINNLRTAYTDPEGTQDPQVWAQLAAEIEKLNLNIRDTFDGARGPEAQRAVSWLFTRYPNLTDASFAMLVPQVSVRLTLDNTVNFLEVGQQILKAPNADNDGDTLVFKPQQILDDEAFARLRAGEQYLGFEPELNIGEMNWEARIVPLMHEAFHAPDGGSLWGHGAGTVVRITTELTDLLGDVLPAGAVGELVDRFIQDVNARDSAARLNLVNGLQRYSDVVNEWSRANQRSAYHEAAHIVARAMEQFQTDYAIHAPKAQLNVATTPEQQATQRAAQVLAAKAVTPGQQLALALEGESMFRKFQKLHFTSLASTATSAADIKRSDLRDMAEWYAELGRGVSDTDLERMQEVDPVVARVYLQLESLAAGAARDLAEQYGVNLDVQQAIAELAGMKVVEPRTDEFGNEVPGDELTLAQLLLRRSVEQERQSKERILPDNDALARKLIRLGNMTRPAHQDEFAAHRATLEILGNLQNTQLVGVDTGPLHPDLTPNQLVRALRGLSPEARKDRLRELRNWAAYIDPNRKSNLPYTYEQVANGDVTAYRALLDAVAAVSNNVVTYSKSKNEKGVVTYGGDYGDRSNGFSGDLEAVHKSINDMLSIWLSSNKLAITSSFTKAEAVQRMLESDVVAARKLYSLIPDKIAPAVLLVRDGKVVPAQWFYEMFAAPTAAAAEMSFYREMLLSEWYMLRGGLSTEGEDLGSNQRAFDKLPRRMLRIMYHLSQPQNIHSMAEFMERLTTSKSVSEFIDWFNFESGLRLTDEQFYLPWVDDVSDFDKDTGGFGAGKASTELGRAMTELRSSVANLQRSTHEQVLAQRADVRLLAKLRDEAKLYTADPSVLPNLSNDFQRWVHVVDFARDQLVQVGPGVMFEQLFGAVYGLAGDSHDKGKTQKTVAATGEAAVLLDALGFTNEHNRMFAGLTAAAIDDVGSNMSEVAKDDLTVMDNKGNLIHSKQPDYAQLLELWADPKTTAYARAMIHPSVLEKTQSGAITTQFLTGLSLSSLIDGSAMSDLYPRDGSELTPDQAMKFITLVEARSRKHGGHFSVSAMITELAIARTSGKYTTMNASDAERVLNRAMIDVAKSLQLAGVLAANPDAAGEHRLELARDALYKEHLDRMKLRSFGPDITPLEGLTVDETIKQIITDAEAAKDQQVVNVLAESANLNLDPNDPDAANKIREFTWRAQILEKRFEDLKARIEGTTNFQTLEPYIRMYGMTGDKVEDRVNRSNVFTHIKLMDNALARAGGKVEALVKDILHYNSGAEFEDIEDVFDAKQWDMLSRFVIAAVFDDKISMMPTSATVVSVPGADNADRLNFYDSSFFYLVRDMLRHDSPAIKASAEVAGYAKTLQPVTVSDLDAMFARTVLNPQEFGRYTSGIAHATSEAYDRLEVASSAQVIPMSGTTPVDIVTLDRATKRDYTVPPQSLLSNVTLDAATFAGLKEFDQLPIPIIDANGAEVVKARPLAQLNNRFFSTAKMTYTDAEGTPQEIDLFADFDDLGHSLRQVGAPDSPYQVVSVERLTAAVTNAFDRINVDPATVSLQLSFFHPESKPAGWYNNVYFDGLNYETAGKDSYDSAIAGLHLFISERNQQHGLDANKTSSLAYSAVGRITSQQRAETEADWSTDFGKMLAAKTRLIMETDWFPENREKMSAKAAKRKEKGSGRYPATLFNGVYKELAMHHFVRMQDENGELQLLPADDFIAWQHANPGVDAKTLGAELITLSQQALRTFLGETGFRGVRGLPVADKTVDYDFEIPQFRGVTKEMLDRLPGLLNTETVQLEQTHLADRARQSVHTVRTMLSKETRTQYEQLLTNWRRVAARVADSRREAQGFDPKKNYGNAVDYVRKATGAVDIDFSQVAPGVMKNDVDQMKALVDALYGRGNESATTRTGFIIDPVRNVDDRAKGILTATYFDNPPESGPDQLAYGDLAVLELQNMYRVGQNDLPKVQRQVEEYLRQLAGAGVDIALVDSSGANNTVNHAADYLYSIGYDAVPGSPGMYRSSATNPKHFQNVKARHGLMSELRYENGEHMHLLALADNGFTDENTIWLNPRAVEQLAEMVETNSVVPSDYLWGFNTPSAGNGEIENVLTTLDYLQSDEGAKLLARLDNIALDGRPASKDAMPIDEAITRLKQRWSSSNGGPMPSEGDDLRKGDIIPMMRNKKVILLRLGMTLPSPTTLNKMFSLAEEGRVEGMNIAISPSEVDTNWTMREGRVIEVLPRSAGGWYLKMAVELQKYGLKTIVEFGGMKYVVSEEPDHVPLPEQPVFARSNKHIAGYSDRASALSKEYHRGAVNNFQNAFATFGVDFRDDIAKAFFGVANATTRNNALELLRELERTNLRITQDQIESYIRDAVMPLELEKAFQTSDKLKAAWDGLGLGVRKLSPDMEASGFITTAIVLYLMTQQGRLSHVLQFGGMNSADIRTGQLVFLPGNFTNLFEALPVDSPTRKELFRRFNDELNNLDVNGAGYALMPDWNFVIQHRTADGQLSVANHTLYVSELHAANANPVFFEQSFTGGARDSVSDHNAALALVASGLSVGHLKQLDQFKAMAAKIDAPGLSEASLLDGTFWKQLTDLPAKDTTFHSWKRERRAETLYKRNARAALAAGREKVDMSRWTEQEKDTYKAQRSAIASKLNLDETFETLVDYWVRATMGVARGYDREGKLQDNLSYKEAIEALSEIKANLAQGFFPTFGAEVDLMHPADLQVLYRASKNGTWLPKASKGGKTLTEWDDWVDLALGSAMNNGDKAFDPLFLMWMDGTWHAYQNATDSLTELPVSLDIAKSLRLLDPQTEDFLSSLSPDKQMILSTSLLVDPTMVELADLIGEERIGGFYRGQAKQDSERAGKQRQRNQWRKKNDIPVPAAMSLKDYRKEGWKTRKQMTNTNAVFRIMYDIRLANGTLNPALWTSAIIESAVRSGLENVKSALTGQGTKGMLAAGASRVGLSEYTPGELKALKSLRQEMGKRGDFLSMVYEDLLYLHPVDKGGSKIERGAQRLAKIGSSIQDPTRGMPGDVLANRYLNTVLTVMQYDPGKYPVTVEALASRMKSDPQYIQKNFPDAHNAGLAMIAEVRALRQTSAMHMINSITKPLSEHPNGLINGSSTLLLKMPLAFLNYGLNAATAILGVQGLDQFMALWADGRRNVLPGQDGYVDMSKVLASYDLADGFIRSGLTHTSLMALGMMMNGVFTGEDEETKRRRRLAKAAGVPFIHDPRALENDFRNSDTIYLGHLPLGLGKLFSDKENPEGAWQAHWAIKQFTSPLEGVARFLEDGNFDHVKWGYEDAITALPNSVVGLWSDTVDTAAQLFSNADAEANKGTDEGMFNSFSLLTKASLLYENMLLENNFVKAVRNGGGVFGDRYDRDPYQQVERNSDGTIKRDAEGNPIKATSLEPAIDPTTGKPRQSYIGRSGWDQASHVLAESRPTFSTLAALWDGVTGKPGGFGGSDYLRANMVVKTQKVKLPEITEQDAKGFVLSQFDKVGQPSITSDEAEKSIRAAKYAAGEGYYGDDTAVAAQVQSMISKDGKHEVLTEDGARNVFHSLHKNVVDFRSASLDGMYISSDMREKIAVEWQADLIKEGVNLGLNEQQAKARANRLWYGDQTTGANGIRELLSSTEMPFNQTLEYSQLNSTYVTGPDGRPWATNFSRGGLLQALGIQPGYAPFDSGDSNLSQDQRMNSVDKVAGINIGLRGLTRKAPEIPSVEDLLKKMDASLKKLSDKPFTTSTGSSTSGSGGSGSGSSFRGSWNPDNPNFTRQNTPDVARTPFGSNIPAINTQTPIIRRASIRRERIDSDRGRLNQWQ